MKLSTRSRYGLRFAFSLAMNKRETPLQLSQVSAQEGISEKYLGHIASQLRVAGIVQSERGARGGYFLTRIPEEITILEVVECLEGGLSLVDCTEDPVECGRESVCAANEIWRILSEKVKETLAELTLGDLVAIHHRKTRNMDFMI